MKLLLAACQFYLTQLALILISWNMSLQFHLMSLPCLNSQYMPSNLSVPYPRAKPQPKLVKVKRLIRGILKTPNPGVRDKPKLKAKSRKIPKVSPFQTLITNYVSQGKPPHPPSSSQAFQLPITKGPSTRQKTTITNKKRAAPRV